MDLPEAPRELLEPLLSGDDAVVQDALVQVEAREEGVQEAMRRALLPALTDLEQTPKVRAGAGLALGRLGDPRPGVGLGENGLPDIEWVTVEAGPFIMGDDNFLDSTKPQFTCNLITQPYRIARYPVTVAQFQAFTGDSDYSTERWWTDAGWAWRSEYKIIAPESYGAAYQTPNHPPQVGVSWYETMAFCAWLSDRLGRPILLPSEAQWERAERHTDGRTFPWGSEDESAARCNMDDSVIGRTSAVGIFPNGDTVSGAGDMAGNVWEWCSTRRLNDYEKYADRTSDDPTVSDNRVVCGGGFDDFRYGVRCAVRVNLGPDFRDHDLGFRVMSPDL